MFIYQIVKLLQGRSNVLPDDCFTGVPSGVISRFYRTLCTACRKTSKALHVYFGCLQKPTAHTYLCLQTCSIEDLDPHGPCAQYTEANDVLRDLKSNLKDDKLLLMQVLASVWRKVFFSLLAGVLCANSQHRGQALPL